MCCDAESTRSGPCVCTGWYCSCRNCTVWEQVSRSSVNHSHWNSMVHWFCLRLRLRLCLGFAYGFAFGSVSGTLILFQCSLNKFIHHTLLLLVRADLNVSSVRFRPPASDVVTCVALLRGNDGVVPRCHPSTRLLGYGQFFFFKQGIAVYFKTNLFKKTRDY
jgi:hypothetical protein